MHDRSEVDVAYKAMVFARNIKNVVALSVSLLHRWWYAFLLASALICSRL